MICFLLTGFKDKQFFVVMGEEVTKKWQFL